MKIAHVTEAWEGGISTYVDSLIRHQLACDEITDIYLIYAENRTKEELTKRFPKGVKFIPYTSSRHPAKLLSVAKKLSQLLSANHIDIAHLHSTFAGVYGRVYHSSCKKVYCAHGWSFVQEKGVLKRLLYRLIERYLARKTDAIIHISDHELEAATKANIIAKQQNIRVYNGVREAVYSQQTVSLNDDSSQFKVGYIGRLDYKKGYDILQRVFTHYSLNNHHLYIIGSPDRDTFHTIKSPHITYLGEVANHEIDDYIKQFDMVVMPSRQEGFGLVAIEVMRNAKPIIASDAGALPELVQDGVNGYVIPQNDKMEQRLYEKLSSLTNEQCLTLGKKGHEIYQRHFSDRQTHQGVLACYQALHGS